VFGAGRWDAFVLKLVSDAPSLTVARAGGTLTLRWRVCASEYIVESSEDYAGHWTPLPEKPILQNGQNTVILSDPAYSSRFFRLRCR